MTEIEVAALGVKQKDYVNCTLIENTGKVLQWKMTELTALTGVRRVAFHLEENAGNHGRGQESAALFDALIGKGGWYLFEKVYFAS